MSLEDNGFAYDEASAADNGEAFVLGDLGTTTTVIPAPTAAPMSSLDEHATPVPAPAATSSSSLDDYNPTAPLLPDDELDGRGDGDHHQPGSNDMSDPFVPIPTTPQTPRLGGTRTRGHVVGGQTEAPRPQRTPSRGTPRSGQRDPDDLTFTRVVTPRRPPSGQRDPDDLTFTRVVTPRRPPSEHSDDRDSGHDPSLHGSAARLAATDPAKRSSHVAFFLDGDGSRSPGSGTSDDSEDSEYADQYAYPGDDCGAIEAVVQDLPSSHTAYAVPSLQQLRAQRAMLGRERFMEQQYTEEMERRPSTVDGRPISAGTALSPEHKPRHGFANASLRRGHSLARRRSTAYANGDGAAAAAWTVGRAATLRRHTLLKLDLDPPKRLQERENLRKELGFFGLAWYDFQLWLQLHRTRRRDPIPLWRKPIRVVEGHFGSGYASFFAFIRWLFLLNCAQTLLWFFAVILPAAVKFDYDTRITETFKAQNVVDGQGPLGQLWFFFGGYSEKAGDTYILYLAYVLVVIVVFVVSLFFPLRSIAHSLSEGYSLVKRHSTLPYSMFTLASWDHNLTAEPAARNLRKGIAIAFRAQLHDDKVKRELPNTNTKTLVIRRVTAWFLWLALMGGSFFAVWELILRDNEFDQANSNFQDQYLWTLVFVVINTVGPFLIKQLPHKLKEEYKIGSMELKVTIARTFLLRVLTLYSFMYALYRRTSLTDKQLPAFVEGTVVDQGDCAGTIIGQEMYKLVIVDTVVVLAGRIAFHFAYKWWFKKRLELDVAQGVLALVYRQGLVWAGMIFCPILPAVALLFTLPFFYVYYFLVLHTCRPPTDKYNQGRHTTFFMGALLVKLVFVFVPITVAMQKYNPNCGPYGADRFDSIYSSIGEAIGDAPHGVRVFFSIITAPAVVTPLVVLAIVFLYVLAVRTRVWKRRYEDLAREVNELRQDKRELIAAQARAIGNSRSHNASRGGNHCL